MPRSGSSARILRGKQCTRGEILVNNGWVRFLAAEEKLVGDYRFGTYDLLVLPPSFPYGGMVRVLPNIR